MNLDDQLLKQTYMSALDQKERDYFIYLPRGYKREQNKQWPVMLFLHGHGERGNGKSELDQVLKHGPLYEAWIQKRELPFIIISPQLHMFDFDKPGEMQVLHSEKKPPPTRLKEGVAQGPPAFLSSGEMKGALAEQNMSKVPALLENGWDKVETDLLDILDSVIANYRVNKQQIIITGLSYGGFGTWYMASKHPQLFSAAVPVVAWGHPDLIESLAKQRIPLWVFAGGRDLHIPLKNFYAGINRLEELGHKTLRFTVHEDMAHDAWTRVYSSRDLYDWMLEQVKTET